MYASKSQGSIHQDDDDMMGYKNQLTEAKLLRKKAEEDAQLLANRIALLQAEERKALKRIDETKKKANEISTIKKQNSLTQKEKTQVKI